MMKKVYCIEEWWIEPDAPYPKNFVDIDDCSFWSSLERPWKSHMWSFVQEFDSEDDFKNELVRIIDSGGTIGRVWIKEVADDYECSLKL